MSRTATVLPDLKGSDRIIKTCAKCAGEGTLRWTNMDAGACWDCNGSGEVSVLVSSVRDQARRASRRAEKASREVSTVADANAAARAQLVAAFPRFEALAASDSYVVQAAIGDAVISVRDGMGVDRAVARLRWTCGEVTAWVRTNKRPGTCQTCRARVPAGAGVCGEMTRVGWVTWCPGHAPESVDL